MVAEAIGRYRRVYARIWRHPEFRRLTSNEQRIALYLLGGPQTNRIGCFHFSLATAAEDLSLSTDTMKKGLARVLAAFEWKLDSEARICYLPTWWRWNKPDNDNVLRGNLKDLGELPPCALVEAFKANASYLPINLRATFVEGVGKRSDTGSPIQEQEQYQEPLQEQDQDSANADLFLSLANEYPEHRRTLDSKTRNAFERLLERGVTVEALQSRLTDHKRSEQWSGDQKYVPSLLNWLDSRWEQMLPPAKKHNQAIGSRESPWRTDCAHVRKHMPTCNTLAQHQLRCEIELECGHPGTCQSWNEHRHRVSQDSDQNPRAIHNELGATNARIEPTR